MNERQHRPSLHLVTGVWGSGKSSVTPHLAELLPECIVFDWDTIILGMSTAAGKDVHTNESTWAGLLETWAAIATSVLAGGRDVVLCGPATPQDFSRLSDINVRCAYLDCPDEVLIDRLRARGETHEAISDEIATAAALRKSGWQAIPVENAKPREMAQRLARWVRSE